MASSPMRIANLLSKRKPKDGLDTRPFLRKHKEQSEDKDTTKGSADILQERIESLETESDQANSILVKETVEGLDQILHFVEESAIRTKTLFVDNLSPDTKISVLIPDIIDFFKTVGKVVRVQLTINTRGGHKCHGFVQFASVNDVKKALETKNGEYLHYHKIFLDVANTAPQPKYCIDHKVCWYKDDYVKNVQKPKMGRFFRTKITYTDDGHPQQEYIPFTQNETPPYSVENVLFVANISPQTDMPHIFDFFKDVGDVRVRLIVNQEGKHVGYGFVEFVSSDEAKEALEMKNGEYLHDHKIFLNMAKAVPYAPIPKYNLAEKLCYEDYLRRVSILIEDDAPMEGLDKTHVFVEAVAVRKKTLFVNNLSRETKISHIIDFFKDVGGVVHVRLVVHKGGESAGYGYVMFASSKKAKTAIQKKNGEYLHNSKIVLEVSNMRRSRCCIDHTVWYEDYLRQESHLIKEDDAVEELDKTPDFVEEVAEAKRTLFVTIPPCRTGISYATSARIGDIHYFFGLEEVRVRLCVNSRGENVGSAFVEFASTDRALKVLKKLNTRFNRRLFLDVVKTAPYPLCPKYNLAEKLWYEDYIGQYGEDYFETLAKMRYRKTEKFCGKKITFPDNDC